MKVIVGTMYCGEKDLDKSIESVKEQNYKVEDHFIIKNLPENEAHYELYNTFKNSDCDMLLKLDADMVLMNSDVIKNFVNQIRKGYMMSSFMVNDFYTNRSLWGIHAYHKNVNIPEKKFFDNKKRLTPDRIGITRKQKITNKKVVAWHCHHSGEKQSFHFGFHRLLKGQRDRCSEVLGHWKTNFDNINMKYCCLGMLVAYERKDMLGYSYGEDFDKIFENNKDRYKNISLKNLRVTKL